MNQMWQNYHLPSNLLMMLHLIVTLRKRTFKHSADSNTEGPYYDVMETGNFLNYYAHAYIGTILYFAFRLQRESEQVSLKKSQLFLLYK